MRVAGHEGMDFGEVVSVLEILRRKSDGPFQGRAGFRQASEAGENDAEEILRHATVRPHGDGALNAGQRLLQPAERIERKTAVDEPLDNIRLDGERAVVSRQGFL